MGDRSYMTLWIYEIPEGKEEEVCDLLEDYGILWDGPANVVVTREDLVASMVANVKDQQHFFNEECSLGTAEEVSEELTKLDVVHQAHQDPKYEWEGVLVRYHPKLGSWIGSANAEASATVSDVDYRRMEVIARNSEEPFEVALLELIGESLGIAYEDDFRQLTGQPDLNKAFGQ